MIKPVSLVEPKKIGACRLDPVRVPTFQGKIDYNKLGKSFETGVDFAAEHIKKGFNYLMDKAPDAVETGKKYGKKAIEGGKKYGSQAIEGGKKAIESTYKFFRDLKTK